MSVYHLFDYAKPFIINIYYIEILKTVFFGIRVFMKLKKFGFMGGYKNIWIAKI